MPRLPLWFLLPRFARYALFFLRAPPLRWARPSLPPAPLRPCPPSHARACALAVRSPLGARLGGVWGGASSGGGGGRLPPLTCCWVFFVLLWAAPKVSPRAPLRAVGAGSPTGWDPAGFRCLPSRLHLVYESCMLLIAITKGGDHDEKRKTITCKGCGL